MDQDGKFTMIDLFAGCGGLSLGLENSGFRSYFVNELNDDARQSYLMNREYSLGGFLFKSNEDLQSKDICDFFTKRENKETGNCDVTNELNLKRLDKLQQDLGNIGVAVGKDLQANSIDLVCGGPPCQGYSGIGHRRNYHVEKEDIPSNRLYEKMAEFIRWTKPKMFLFENVRGLLNARWTSHGKKGEIWSDVLSYYRSLGYEVRWDLIRARDYGVPQNRPRVLMVGIHKELINKLHFDKIDLQQDSEKAIACGFLPNPTDLEDLIHTGEKIRCPNIRDLLGDLVDPSVPNILKTGAFGMERFETTKYPASAKTPEQKYFRRIKNDPSRSAAKGTLLTEHEYSRHSSRIVQKFSLMIDGQQLKPEMLTKKFSQKVLPAEWKNNQPTITTTSMPDDYVHYSQPRSLTVREWARLQTFPDWYKFSGKRTTGGLRRAGNPKEHKHDREAPKYTQIGNAVPVILAEHLGRHFSKILGSIK